MSGEEKTQLGITIADLQKQIDNGVKSLAEVEVAVFLADDLKERISPDDTLFIFAKAAQGPAVPLAVHRTTAGALPLTVVLNDDMAMTPNLKLSALTPIPLSLASQKKEMPKRKRRLVRSTNGQSRRSNCFIHQPNTTLIAAKTSRLGVANCWYAMRFASCSEKFGLTILKRIIHVKFHRMR